MHCFPPIDTRSKIYALIHVLKIIYKELGWIFPDDVDIFRIFPSLSITMEGTFGFGGITWEAKNDGNHEFRLYITTVPKESSDPNGKPQATTVKYIMTPTQALSFGRQIYERTLDYKRVHVPGNDE